MAETQSGKPPADHRPVDAVSGGNPEAASSARRPVDVDGEAAPPHLKGPEASDNWNLVQHPARGWTGAKKMMDASEAEQKDEAEWQAVAAAVAQAKIKPREKIVIDNIVTTRVDLCFDNPAALTASIDAANAELGKNGFTPDTDWRLVRAQAPISDTGEAKYWNKKEGIWVSEEV